MSSRARSTPSSDWPAVSTVLTVLNEEHHLRSAVRSVLAQDYPGPMELVLALGPSSDRTDEVAAALAVEDPRVLCVKNPSGRTPEGLNKALAASHHPVVARVDGHAELPPDYLRVAVELLQSTGAVNVGGLMWALGKTDFERAVARAMTSRFGVGNAPFHIGGEEGSADTVYLGVFRREALEAVGGYDEAFTRAQDWELNYRLRRAGGLIWFTPALRVSYRPRGSIRSLAGQYFNYGRWRRELMRQHPTTVSLRYLAPPTALLAVTLGLLAGAAGFLWAPLLRWALVLPLGYALGVLTATVATGAGLPGRARLWLPAVYATMHGSWGAGFLSSVRRYTRHGSP
jgi:glycosyltransferase involved in cell wall biosynthesis